MRVSSNQTQWVPSRTSRQNDGGRVYDISKEVHVIARKNSVTVLKHRDTPSASMPIKKQNDRSMISW